MFTKAGQANALNRHSINQHLALLRCVHAEDDLNQSRLAATAGAHQGHFFAGRQLQIDAPEHLLLAISEMDIAQGKPHGMTVAERVLQRRIAGLFFQIQQPVDTPERRIGGEPGVLHVEHFLNRRQHEPEVAENGEHHADAQVAEQHGYHRGGPERVDAELEQGKTGPAGCIAAPFELDRVVPHVAGAVDQLAKVMLFPISRPQLVNRIQGFGQVALEVFVSAVLPALQLLDPLADQNRGEDNQRIEQQNE